MPTNVRVYESTTPECFIGIAFHGHSSAEDGDNDMGMRLCASMSTLASVVEAYIETLGIAHNLSIVPAPPEGIPIRSITWDKSESDKMKNIVMTVKHIAWLLSAQYPDYISVSVIQG